MVGPFIYFYPPVHLVGAGALASPIVAISAIRSRPGQVGDICVAHRCHPTIRSRPGRAGDASVPAHPPRPPPPYYCVKSQEAPLPVIPHRRPPGEVWKNLLLGLSLSLHVDSSLRSE